MKLTLEELPSAGYIWQSEPELPHKFTPIDNTIGSGGSVTFEFSKDNLPIRFCYGRPWENQGYKEVLVLTKER